MSKFILRRLLIAIPTLFAISFVVFAILELSPVDPLGNLPLTITPEEREKIREAMGANAPFHVKYAKWVVQFVINEPLNILEQVTGIKIGDSEGRLRYISYQTRSPIVDLVIQRLPQTLWVVGTAYLLSVLIAVPIGVLSAYKPYSIFDQVGTFFAIVGYSLPTFFTGLLFIIIFSVNLKWFPSVYDTTHRVTDMQSLLVQAPADLYADTRPCAVLHGADQPVYALVDARTSESRLHPDGALKRHLGTRRDYAPRPAQQPDPGRDARRAGNPGDLSGRDHH